MQASFYHQHAVSMGDFAGYVMKEFVQVQCLRNCFYFLRITSRSVILLMCLALRIAVRNSKGKL